MVQAKHYDIMKSVNGTFGYSMALRRRAPLSSCTLSYLTPDTLCLHLRERTSEVPRNMVRLVRTDHGEDHGYKALRWYRSAV